MQRGRWRTRDAAIVRVVAGLDLQPRFEDVQRAHEHRSDGAGHAASHTVDHDRVIELLALRMQSLESQDANASGRNAQELRASYGPHWKADGMVRGVSSGHRRALACMNRIACVSSGVAALRA